MAPSAWSGIAIADRFANSPTDFGGHRVKGGASKMARKRGTKKSDVMVGDNGKHGADHFWGLGHDDFIRGRGGDDVIYGGDGWDYLWGGTGNDAIYGGNDGDLIRGNPGNDRLYGEGEVDFIRGGDGNDYIDGGDEGDSLQGNGGSDYIFGNRGRDRLFGDDGNDVLNGGANEDVLTGDSGADTFYFASAGDANGDIVTDFTQGVDTLAFATSSSVRFIGTGLFSGSGSFEIRQTTNGIDTFLEADYDGSGTVDATVQLYGVHWLTSGDFA